MYLINALQVFHGRPMEWMQPNQRQQLLSITRNELMGSELEAEGVREPAEKDTIFSL